jgi:UDP-2,4-diacetamido-2,4,6-trideoxy-beta-L-altropyranose hydrolase
MWVVFRTGGGKQVGFGHIRRCLSLAHALRSFKADSTFILDGDTKAIDIVKSEGYPAALIDGDDFAQTSREVRSRAARAVVVDSYSYPASNLKSLKSNGNVLIVLDDLATEFLPVDLVVNGTAGAEDLPYVRDPSVTYLLGSSYILLRPEFEDVVQRSYDSVRRILLTLGGSDTFDLTPRVVEWVRSVFPDVEIDVVVGPLSFNRTDIEAAASRLEKVHLHHEPDIGRLMRACDVALSGGGQTTYELAATGTPAVAIRVAANQTLNLKGLCAARTLIWAGDASDTNLREQVIQALRTLAGSRSLRREMGSNGRRLVDGRGAVRVAEKIVAMVANL